MKIVKDVWDCIQLLQGLDVKYEIYRKEYTCSVTYGAWWEGDTLIIMFDGYLQSQWNVVAEILPLLKEAGLIKEYRCFWVRGCTSATCRHITHDEYDLEHAEVEV